MRMLVFVLFSIAVILGVSWMSRPAALGDAGGFYAMVDTKLPMLANWRANYLKSSTQTAVAGDGGKTAAKPKAPPVAVATQTAQVKTLDISFNGLGTVQAIASIVVKPRVDSQVLEVPVAEGAAVKTGDLLFKLDDSALKAQLATSEAQIAKDKALLDQNQHDLARNLDLEKQKFVAPQIVETAQTAVSQTQAQIGVDNGLRAALIRQIGYMEIHSSINGRIGSIAAKPGAAVKSGDTLATVNQIDPIYIAFSIPQDKFVALRTAMAKNQAKVVLRDDPAAPAGTVGFIENAVDTATGTIVVKAVMPNKDEKLWPGAFANVTLVTGTQEALVVSSAAVQIGQKGPYVFIARDGHAHLQLVKVERTVGDLIVVSEGVAAGDQVVTSGQLALTDGAEVTIAKPASADDGKGTAAKTASQG